MQGKAGAQPLLNSGNPQFNQTISPGFNGPTQPIQYNRKAALGLGITQMIIGIICVILNSVLIAFGWSYFVSLIGYGIWGGMMVFVAGLLQVLSAKRAENRCLIIGTMVMTILAACLRIGTIGISVRATGAVDFGIGITMSILAITEVVIAVVTSVICCRAVYRTPSNMTPIPVQIAGNQPVIVQSNYPGMVLQPGQNPNWGGQYSQMPFNPYPQVPGNPGLSSNPGQNPTWGGQSSSMQMQFNPYPQVPGNSGLSSNPGQNPIWGEQSSMQMPFNPYLQVSVNPGLPSNPGQNPSWGEQPSSQVPFNPYPQVPMDPGLPANPPPAYNDSCNPETK